MTSRACVPGARRVVRLRIYPVKGAHGTDLQALDFDEMGPRFDRRWMVVGPGGDFVSQRQTHLLATVRPRVADGFLHLEAPGMQPLAVPVTSEGDALRVGIWGAAVDACTVAPAADAWLSSVLGGEHRLVFMRDGDRRLTDPSYAEGHRVTFADGYPALLVSEGSVEELARRAGRVIPVDRFRPNIVVTGAHPHGEDRWRRFTLGALAFSGVKLCTRCKVTTLDQDSGVRDPDSEPLRTLALYRKIEDKVYFGINVVHHGTGRIAVGDAVEVRERGIVPGYRITNA